MRNKAIGLLIFIWTGMLNSCSVKHDNANTILVDLSSKANVNDFFEDSHSVTLATEDECLIKNIDKIWIELEKIYILDKQNYSIIIFDINGNYLNQLKRRGNGQEEYPDIADFMVIDSEILILSRVMKKILVYSTSLDYIKSYPLDDFYDYCHYSDKKIVLYSNYSNRTRFNINVFDMKTHEVKERFLPFKRNQSFSFSPTPFNTTIDGNLLITQQYDYNIYDFKQDSIDVILKLDFNTRDKIPDNFQDIGFEKLYQDLLLQSVVKRIEYINKMGDCFYIIFIYDHAPHITQISRSKNTTRTLKLEFNDIFPFVFAHRIGFYKNYLIGYLHASDALKFNSKFPSDKTPSSFLSEDDNPVLFFHRLKK
jgi:hypothetical protein